MSVVTRFAPSPTGYLHIGGARTALFNWLYSHHHRGKFLLRIEDTDRQRSTQEAIDAILDGLSWLGLDWDGEPLFQSVRAERHVEVAYRLLKEGKAYRCYASQEELEEMRQQAKAEGRPMRYDGRWRDRDPSEAPPGVDPVIRIKMPREGETIIEDGVQGRVTIANEQLDDLVMLRADGSPTYMLSVVVDDHDMGITDVIRGDDHLTNAFRQTQLYNAMGWRPPAFAHIPLIHGPDGAKLSKRHGALGVETYRDMGYLPEAMRNYLLRLGWGHGDDEIISTEDAVNWFDLDGIGRSPARFDFAKLDHLNAHYLREAHDARLVELIRPELEAATGHSLNVEDTRRLLNGMEGLKSRARTTKQLAENARFYVESRPVTKSEQALKILDLDAITHLRNLRSLFAECATWDRDILEQLVRDYVERQGGLKLGKVAQPLRAALTGTKTSPPIFEVMEVLGREETLGRIDDCLA